jgi:heme A synthase
MIKTIHSYWAYLVLFFLLIAVYRAISCTILKKEYNPKMFRVALITLIVSHIQILIAFLLYFTSNVRWFDSDTEVSTIMKNSDLRLYNLEHPLVMILTVVFITVGYSKHKKKLTSTPKLKMLAIFYTLALILLLSRIPWSSWLTF